MNPIKTKPPDRAPHIKTDAARAPKELMRRSLLSARKQAQSVAEPRQPQDEQPEQYAEARIEHAAANAAHRIGNETAYRAKRLMLKASRRIKQNRQSQGETEQSVPPFILPKAIPCGKAENTPEKMPKSHGGQRKAVLKALSRV